MPTNSLTTELAQIKKAQAAYREIVEATVRILKNHGFTHYPRNAGFNAAINWLSFSETEDLIAAAVKHELQALFDADRECDIKGDDHEQFFDRMYALLKANEAAELDKAEAEKGAAA